MSFILARSSGTLRGSDRDALFPRRFSSSGKLGCNINFDENLNYLEVRFDCGGSIEDLGATGHLQKIGKASLKIENSPSPFYL